MNESKEPTIDFNNVSLLPTNSKYYVVTQKSITRLRRFVTSQTVEYVEVIQSGTEAGPEKIIYDPKAPYFL